jgi:uncharacterized protein
MRMLRVFEILILFVALPVSYARGWVPLPIVPVLVIVGLYAWRRLLRDPAFHVRSLGWGGADARAVRRMVLVALPVALALSAAVWLFRPERLFQFPLQRPRLWVLIMFLYPVLSVYPQEVIYRAFFDHRCRALLPNDRARRWVGALVFGLHHAVFGNAVAVILSLLGGWKFANTYARNRSLLLAAIEHAIYGCILFTIGLGDLFYDGSLRTSVYGWFR